MQDGISLKIIELRRQKGLSQRDLGDALGVSNRAVSKWENGLSKPTIENLMKIAQIYKIPIEYLLYTEEEDAGGVPAGMESLRDLYKTGRGPSSSHTIGPEKACLLFMKKYPAADEFAVTLYGSLAKTGAGHGTDRVIEKTFSPLPCTVRFDTDTEEKLLPHPNTMDLYAYQKREQIGFMRVSSIGGGKIRVEHSAEADLPKIYRHHTFEEISSYCNERGMRLWEYVEEAEGDGFRDYMTGIWNAMKDSIRAGLSDEGILPGGLEVVKKAKHLYNQQHIDESAETKENRVVCSYAFAVSEQNASGEVIVTAPTCGAAGVVPAVLYYQQKKRGYSDLEIVHALMSGGVVGNLVKTNASISGAECGCQAEVGTACAMASAALAELFELDLAKIEYAAEIAIEHHLGLTCDPICGLVQIPCIERNAVAAMRAINAVSLASFLSDTRKISLDKVINAMRETGKDIAKAYRETSEGGLAKIKIN